MRGRILAISIFFIFLSSVLSVTLAQNKNEGPPPIPKKVTMKQPALETPPPIPKKKEYWVVFGEEQKGPFDLMEIKKMIEENKIVPDTLIWKKGMKNWTEAKKIAELNEFFGKGPPKLSLTQIIKRRLVGTWHAEFEKIMNGMPNIVEIEVTYLADGTFTGVHTYRIKELAFEMSGIEVPPTTITVQGTWKVKPISSKKFTLIEKVSAFAPGTGPITDTNISKCLFLDKNHLKNLTEGYVLTKTKEE